MVLCGCWAVLHVAGIIVTGQGLVRIDEDLVNYLKVVSYFLYVKCHIAAFMGFLPQ